MEYPNVVMEDSCFLIDRGGWDHLYHLYVSSLRWFNAKKSLNKSWVKMIGKEEAFCFRWAEYGSLQTVMALTLIPHKFDSWKNIAVYCPHRLLQQFQYNQGIIRIIGWYVLLELVGGREYVWCYIAASNSHGDREVIRLGLVDLG